MESYGTCLTHRAEQRRWAQEDPYWRSYEGLLRRVDSISQVFTYRTVNNATKVVAPTLGVEWLYWEDAGDIKVCDECLRRSRGGREGYFRITWFMPQMPVHPRCRCRWVLVFGDPFKY